MKRKLSLLALCAIAILFAGLILSAKNQKRTGAGSTQSLVIVTQDGKITMVPQSSYAQPVVLWHGSTATTNAASRSTTPKQ